MFRFFVNEEQVDENVIYIEGNDVNHIKNVLRMKKGDCICISNRTDKDYICELMEIMPEQIVASILDVIEVEVELPSKIYLFQGLPKGDKMELIIQKAVELGVFEIIPICMKNCVVKLDEKKAQLKTKRWQAIAEGGAKQSKRMHIPIVQKPMSFIDALEYASDLDVKLLPYEHAEGMGVTKQLMKSIVPGESIGIWIGPEGGFDEAEVVKAKETGFVPISLGRRILRTETAGLMMLSILMFQLET